MLAGLVIGVASISMLTLLVLGFAANTERFEDRMRPPGCYWTWAMAIGLVMGAVIGSPLLAQVFGYVVLLLAAALWVTDINRKEGAR